MDVDITDENHPNPGEGELMEYDEYVEEDGDEVMDTDGEKTVEMNEGEAEIEGEGEDGMMAEPVVVEVDDPALPASVVEVEAVGVAPELDMVSAERNGVEESAVGVESVVMASTAGEETEPTIMESHGLVEPTIQQPSTTEVQPEDAAPLGDDTVEEEPHAQEQGEGEGEEHEEEEYYGEETEGVEQPVGEGETVEGEAVTIGEGAEAVEVDEDSIPEEGEEQPITSQNLPPIILTIPQLGPRALFSGLDEDGKPLDMPVLLAERHADLAEASLSDVWKEIKAEIQKEMDDEIEGEMVITEKVMQFRMGEYDLNLKDVTFIDIIRIYYGVELPTPVQLFVTFDTNTFITRYNAIKIALENDGEVEEEEGENEDHEGEWNDEEGGDETYEEGEGEDEVEETEKLNGDITKDDSALSPSVTEPPASNTREVHSQVAERSETLPYSQTQDKQATENLKIDQDPAKPVDMPGEQKTEAPKAVVAVSALPATEKPTEPVTSAETPKQSKRADGKTGGEPAKTDEAAVIETPKDQPGTEAKEPAKEAAAEQEKPSAQAGATTAEVQHEQPEEQVDEEASGEVEGEDAEENEGDGVDAMVDGLMEKADEGYHAEDNEDESGAYEDNEVEQFEEVEEASEDVETANGDRTENADPDSLQDQVTTEETEVTEDLNTDSTNTLQDDAEQNEAEYEEAEGEYTVDGDENEACYSQDEVQGDDETTTSVTGKRPFEADEEDVTDRSKQMKLTDDSTTQ